MTPAEILALIKENDVKFVDLRFSDTKGKEQHVTVPAHVLDEDLFEEGKMFDGSSISGWKGINESDMILLPDAASAVLDIFSEDTTLNLRCNVVEPTTMQGYDRCPRSLADRAEAYLKSTGIADAAYFGPENEFFVFDDVRWDDTMQGAYYRSIPAKVPGIPAAVTRMATPATGRPSRAAIFRYHRSIRCTTCVLRCASPLKKWALKPRCITMRSPLRDSAKLALNSIP